MVLHNTCITPESLPMAPCTIMDDRVLFIFGWFRTTILCKVGHVRSSVLIEPVMLFLRELNQLCFVLLWIRIHEFEAVTNSFMLILKHRLMSRCM